MKLHFWSWRPGQRRESGPLAAQEIELTKKEEAALKSAHAIVIALDKDLAQRSAAEFLPHLLQNAVMNEEAVENALACRDWGDARDRMQMLDKYVRPLNIIIHKMLGEEKKRQTFLNNLLTLLERITKLQIQAEKTLSEEE